MLTTTVFGFKKPQTSDAPSALRTAIGDNADRTEQLLNRWERFAIFSGRLGAALSTRQYFVAGPPSGNGAAVATAAGFNQPLNTVHITSQAAGTTTRLRMRFHWLTGATGPGVALTVGLYDAAGILVSGSDITFTPASGSLQYATSSRETIFDLLAWPGQNAIIPAVTPASATAGSSTIDFVVFIDRQIL